MTNPPPPARSAVEPAKLRALREEIGWTVRFVSQRFGVDYSTIRCWERGKHKAPRDYEVWLRAVAAAIRLANRIYLKEGNR